jgi:hypothetical protein
VASVTEWLAFILKEALLGPGPCWSLPRTPRSLIDPPITVDSKWVPSAAGDACRTKAKLPTRMSRMMIGARGSYRR